MSWLSDFVKYWEKCRLVAFLPTDRDRWTIGWGHTADVHPGMVITQEQADAALDYDLKAFSIIVRRMLPTSIPECQFEALCSLAYNIGVSALFHSTLRSLLLSGDTQGAADQFLVWNHQNHVVLDGLTKRREAERAHFLGMENGVLT